MENNFDITKIYTETENKKKIGISSIFSIFIGKGRDKKKVENIEKPFVNWCLASFFSIV